MAETTRKKPQQASEAEKPQMEDKRKPLVEEYREAEAELKKLKAQIEKEGGHVEGDDNEELLVDIYVANCDCLYRTFFFMEGEEMRVEHGAEVNNPNFDFVRSINVTFDEDPFDMEESNQHSRKMLNQLSSGSRR